MRLPQLFALLIAASVSAAAWAEPIQTVDLKSFAGASPADSMDANWQIPRGHQVLDGIPFQIEGVVSFRAANSAQRSHPGRTNLTDIHVTARFDRLHLLGGADAEGPDGTAVATVEFHYLDGSQSNVVLRMGENIAYWAALRHKAEKEWSDKDVHEVWRAQNSSASASDKYLRLFHVPLANPSPEKEVKSLAIESAGKQCGLLLLAMSAGPASAPPLPDTVAAARNTLPDLTPRTGALAQLEGLIRDTNGVPVTNAFVRIGAVREINGANNNTIEDDPDIGKVTAADKSGRFVLPALSDRRSYSLQAYAEGYRLNTFTAADPKGDPIEIRLKASPEGKQAGKFSIRAQVLGTNGEPMAGVIAETDGVGYNGGTSWGSERGFPDKVMTGTNGQFQVGRDEPFSRLQIRVKQPGLAPMMVWLSPSNTLQTIQLVTGARLHGRVLLKDGTPLAGVRIGVSGHDRNSEVFVGHFETKTDTNGVFEFPHLPPSTSWDLFGVMASLKTYGAIPQKLVQTPGNDGETDAGDMTVVPGLHLAGEVRMKQGGPLPKGLQVYVGYESGWDSLNTKLDSEGKFRFEGLSAGVVNVSVNASGGESVSLTGDNYSLNQWNPWELTGKLEQDMDDLLLVVARRARRYYGGSGNGQLPTQDWPQNHPLHGAEASGPEPIVLAGSVVDDSTGKPVPEFKIIPGYKPPVTATMAQPQKSVLQKIVEPFAKKKGIPWNERIFWEYQQEESISNGFFSATFRRLSSSPVLQIQSKNYESLETDPTNVTVTNLVLRLKRGAGPNGVVLLPDGKPAEGATVVFGASGEQFSMRGAQLDAYGQTEWRQVTGKDGKFSFLTKADARELFVAHPKGWAQLAVDKGGGDGVNLSLKPWAAITGILVDSNHVPAAGVSLQVTMFQDWQQGGALVNLQGGTTTDGQGRFLFTNIPPARVELQRMVPSGFGGSTYVLQTWLVASPGITNDLGRVIEDHPPDPTMIDKLRQKLGL